MELLITDELDNRTRAAICEFFDKEKIFLYNLTNFTEALDYLFRSPEERERVNLSPEAHILCNEIQAVYNNRDLPQNVKLEMLDHLVALHSDMKQYLALRAPLIERLQSPHNYDAFTLDDIRTFASDGYRDAFYNVYAGQERLLNMFMPLIKSNTLTLGSKFLNQLSYAFQRAGRYELHATAISPEYEAERKKEQANKGNENTEELNDNTEELKDPKYLFAKLIGVKGFASRFTTDQQEHERQEAEKRAQQAQQERKRQEYARQKPIQSRVYETFQTVKALYTDTVQARKKKHEIARRKQEQRKAGTSTNFAIPVPVLPADQWPKQNSQDKMTKSPPEQVGPAPAHEKQATQPPPVEQNTMPIPPQENVGTPAPATSQPSAAKDQSAATSQPPPAIDTPLLLRHNQILLNLCNSNHLNQRRLLVNMLLGCYRDIVVVAVKARE